MNRWEMRRQFGMNPSLAAVLGYALQHALKGIGVRHPDHKRQRKNRLRDLTISRARRLKQEVTR